MCKYLLCAARVSDKKFRLQHQNVHCTCKYFQIFAMVTTVQSTRLTPWPGTGLASVARSFSCCCSALSTSLSLPSLSRGSADVCGRAS